MFPAKPVPIDSARRDEAIDVSHARNRAATRNLPFYVTHVTHKFSPLYNKPVLFRKTSYSLFLQVRLPQPVSSGSGLSPYSWLYSNTILCAKEWEMKRKRLESNSKFPAAKKIITEENIGQWDDSVLALLISD
ncbi:hypothetical protein DdX_00239 [Ditylenchus destructor]|uniref:Uncharacterized protein n=1 Tax=Ditylenchus destructor TaxID=166010 RepID=A0AAD4NG57_9BILA|nr:hypothetical protein DdX_00239 [Ditylenchus destructor]